MRLTIVASILASLLQWVLFGQVSFDCFDFFEGKILWISVFYLFRFQGMVHTG